VPDRVADVSFVNSYRFGSAAPPSAIFLAAKTATYTAGTTQTVSLTDLLDASSNSVTLQQNDVIVVTMLRTSTSNVGAAAVSPSSTGYTLVSNLYADDAWDCNFGVNYKIMGASPDSSVNLPGTGGGGMAVHIFAIRGVNGTTPLDVTVATATGVNSGTVDPGSITPVTAGSLITVHGGIAQSTAITLPTSSDLTHFSAASVSGSGFGGSTVGAGAKTDWTSGAFDPAAWVEPSGSSWVAVTIAWRPA
jgi:hypothetical protein